MGFRTKEALSFSKLNLYTLEKWKKISNQITNRLKVLRLNTWQKILFPKQHIPIQKPIV